MSDSVSEVAEQSDERRLKRPPRYYESQLDRYKFEILQKDQAGAKNLAIRQWLESKDITVHKTTLWRWLKKNR